MATEKTVITYIRHAQQTSHRTLDPAIKAPPAHFDISLDYIISSPYRRCRQTADAILKLDSAAHPESEPKSLVIDVRISEYQGSKSPKTGSPKMDPSSMVFGPLPPIDETWEDFVRRMEEHWEWVTTLTGQVLIVTHGVVVNYMHEKVTGKKLYSRGREVPFVTGFSFSFDD